MVSGFPPFAMRARGNPCGVRVLGLDEPVVMGVVNVTPDSFSDGGKLADSAAAIAHGQALWRVGATILDVGGEATNPRAQAVSAAVELARVLPVIEGLAATTDAVISIDTTKAEVARAALAAGAEIVNDVAGGQFDPAILGVVDDAGAGYVLGHLRGANLAAVFAAEAPIAWTDVRDELVAAVAALPASLRGRTMIDPGIGFGKGADPATNLALLAHSGALAAAVGRPILVGPSRKRFLARVIGDRSGSLDEATVGACLAAVAAGAHAVRVHDVAPVVAALAAYRSTARSFVATSSGDV